jgi:hypothetical protein
MWFSTPVAALALATIAHGQHDGDTSPPRYPSPWMRGGNGWQDAYAKAQKFVSGLTLLEKINLTTGVGWEGESCVGNTGKSELEGYIPPYYPFLKKSKLVNIRLLLECNASHFEYKKLYR